MGTVNVFGICTSFALLAAAASPAAAQTPEPDTRQAVIEQAESQKAAKLQPFVPSGGERFATKVESTFINPIHAWHPFFENSYRGGGFAPGLGYMWHVSPYSYVDIRGSYSIKIATNGPKPSSIRRACSTGGENCRFWAGGATRPRSPITASAWTPPQRPRELTGSNSPTDRRCSRCGRHATSFFCAAASSIRAGT